MLDGSIVTLILFGLFGYLFYLYLTWNYKYWWKRGVIGPKAKVISGTYPSMFSADKNIVYDMCNANKNFKETENFVGMYSFRQPQLLLLSPDSIKEVLVDKFHSFHDNDISKNVDSEVDDILSKSPFFSKGESWQKSRSEITNAFEPDCVKNSYPEVLETCRKLVKLLEKKSQYPPINGINVKDIALRFIAEIISHTVYGMEAGDFEKEELPEFLRVASSPFAQSILTSLYFLVPSSLKFKKVAFLPDTTKDYLNDLIQKSINQRKEKKVSKGDFLNFLQKLQEEKGLSPSELSFHAITFMIDGFETTATLITHVLLLLAKYPECQKKLRSEIEENLQEDEHTSFESISKLKYLEMCINESLRMFPPHLYSTKICSEDCQLMNKNGQPVLINSGTCVVIPTYAIHHDEDYFTEADVFNPERFSLENGGVQKYIDQRVFLPFGSGPRKCLGFQYAYCQTKSIIVEIVKSFNIKLNSNTRTDNKLDGISYVAALEGGVWLDFEAIKKTA